MVFHPTPEGRRSRHRPEAVAARCARHHGSRPAALNKLTELDPATIHTNESGGQGPCSPRRSLTPGYHNTAPPLLIRIILSPAMGSESPLFLLNCHEILCDGTEHGQLGASHSALPLALRSVIDTQNPAGKTRQKMNLLVTQWRLQILKEERIPSSDLVLLFPNCEF